MEVRAAQMRKVGSVLEELMNLRWGTDKQTVLGQLARAVIKHVNQVYGSIQEECRNQTECVCLRNQYRCGQFPLTSGFNMYLSFPMLTVKSYESHSPAGRSLSVLFTYLLPFSNSRTKFAFYVEADWPIALLMEG